MTSRGVAANPGDYYAQCRADGLTAREAEEETCRAYQYRGVMKDAPFGDQVRRAEARFEAAERARWPS